MSRPPRGAPRVKASKSVRVVPTKTRREPALRVLGRLDRLGHLAMQTAFYLPEDVRERIEARRVEGAFSSALVGLLVFALDEIERQGVDLAVLMDSETSLPK